MLNIQPVGIQRGDVYWVQVPEYGSQKARPWVVLNPEPPLQMVPSTTVPPKLFPEAHIEIQLPSNRHPSYFKCAHILNVDPAILGQYITTLSDQEMDQIFDASRKSRGPTSKPAHPITKEPPPMKSKQSQPAILPDPNLPIKSLPSWSHILDLPTDEQAALLKDMSLYHTVKELADHYMVHPQSIYARINKLGQRMSKNNKAKQPKQEPVVVPVFVPAIPRAPDLEATMLGSYIIKLLDPKKKYHIILTEVD